jgi:HD-GYP domain-containing protein (c-di-GMP phosphodiesterase class II)/HAMP domain-containing protein
MRIRSLAIERKFLDSRVARRLFWIVAACALLPVAAFALFSYVQVRGQLEDDASSALRSAVKESGLAIIERLLMADEALRLRVRDSSRDSSASVPKANSRALRAVRELGPGDPQLGRLDSSDQDRLSSDHGLLLVDVNSDGPRLLLVRRTDPSDPSKGTWLAEVNPAFVFEAERHRPNDRFWIRDSEGRTLFWSPRSWRPQPQDLRAGGTDARASHADIAGEASLVVSWRMFPQRTLRTHAWILSLSRPLEDIYRPLREFEAVFPWIVGITLCVALGLLVSQIRRTLVPIDALTRGARRIAAGDFDTRVDVLTGDEFGYLSESFNHMAEVIGDQVRVLNTMNTIGGTLSAESDTDRLLALILRGSMRVTRASGGVLFLLTEEGALEASRMCVGEDNIVTGESADEVSPLRVAERCIERRALLRAENLSDPSDPERSQWEVFERRLGEPIAGYLALPMSSEKGEPIGVLLLVHTGHGRFSDDDAALAQSLASQAAVAVRKNRLVESFRGLFEGVVQLTVHAIDEKSAYTGDHCRKVPLLAELIAHAACADRVGSLKDFDLTEDERYEMRIAALLHDCGKVVTPVHVMDKATKLETISDRIEVVETRFEVLRCDARVRALTRQLEASGTAPGAGDDPQLARELAAIEDDLEFVRACNRGQERMSEADCTRIREIADRRQWKTRTSKVRHALEADEVTNLTIRRGTLNEAEREIIQQHVVLTMRMLEALPWPRELRQVPAIAGAHHERVDGTGYPLGLHAAQLSVQARILGLADVFEALTAKSRPYKPGRTLTETLEILDAMSKEGHIDPGLYEVFLREKLHLRYAVEHLSPEQIDSEHQADIERLTDPTGA